MNIEKTAIVCFSPTGNSRKIAAAIARGVGCESVEYDITHLYKESSIPEFGANDLVIVSAPVYVGRVPYVITDILRTLKGNSTPCVLAGTFGNRHYDDYLVELEDLMNERGFLPVAAAVFTAEHSFSKELAGGRPDEKDLAVAKEFGRKIKEKLSGAPTVQVLPTGAIPGGRPYREPFVNVKNSPPTAPEVSDACIDCKKCAGVCPTGAISPSDVKDITAQKCIRCRACAHVCPTGAIDIASETFWAHTKQLVDKFGGADFEPVLVV